MFFKTIAKSGLRAGSSQIQMLLSVFASILLSCSFLLFTSDIFAHTGFEVWQERLSRPPAGRDLREPLRQMALAAVDEDRIEECIDLLSSILQHKAGDDRGSVSFTTTQINSAVFAADLLNLFRNYFQGSSPMVPPLPVTQWLLQSPERLELLIDNLSPDDNWAEVCRILKELYNHDPEGRDDFFELILALAVVWDQPRPPLHRQKGNSQLPFERDITARYDYYKDLYTSRHARISYDRLSVTALKFVIDTPVPLSELEWARDNVRGSASRWDRKFSDIEYDEGRLYRQAFQWERGDYTLQAIERHGGICVDQAYYGVMTARAVGIPAIIFTGIGRRGPHAWMGHMARENRWDMDTGRYDQDEYLIGQTIDPQNNLPMSDHALDLSCSRAFRVRRGDDAFRYYRLARQLKESRQYRFAVFFAERAVRIIPILNPAWELLEEIALAHNADDRLMEILDRKQEAFSRYPDELFAIHSRQAQYFIEGGQLAKADEVFAQMSPRISRRRQDLARRVMTKRVELLIRDDRHREAREVIESFLDNHRDSGAKVLPVLNFYLRICQNLEQEEEAASFIRRFVSRVRTRSAGLEEQLLKLEIEACELAGDQRGADRASRRLERLR